MTERTARRVASGVNALTLVLCVAGVVLLVASRSAEVTLDFSFRGAFIILAATLSAVGWLIARHRADNPIGWIFSFAGVVGAILFAAEQYGVFATVYRPGSLPAGAIVDWLGSLLYPVSLGSLMVYGFLLFPDGRLPTRPWRFAAWLGPVGISLIVVALAIRPGPLDSIAAAPNPFGMGGAQRSYNVLVGAGGMIMALASLLAVASLVARLRRSAGVRRQQIKWLVYSAAFVPILVSVGGVLPAGSWQGKTVQTLAIVAIAGVPIGAGIGILRYRLYEIDRIINRTIVYGAVTALLAGAYAGSVFLLGFVTKPITRESDPAVAVATLATAAAFRPVRRRVQAAVDRRFNRSRYDAAKTLDAFSSRLREEFLLDALVSDLRSVVTSAMGPRQVTVWLPGREK